MKESIMKKELLDVPVLAMYDVRGIQEYIFRTNRVKEIVGGSKIVEDIIQDTLAKAVDELKIAHVEMSWHPDKSGQVRNMQFLKEDSDMDIEVLFIGGGNAYLIYRTGRLCEQVNRKMSRLILETTYSLQLAVSVVKANIEENDYKSDYEKLRSEMDRVKAKMPFARTFGALPVVKADSLTGFPLLKQDMSNMKNEGDLSKESYLKLSKWYIVKNEENKAAGKNVEREFDELVTQHGEESVLAIVHIDGNDMGKRIGQLLAEKSGSYNEAIKTMRTVSYNINHIFKDLVFEDIKKKFENWIVNIKSNKPGEDIFDEKGTYLRKIIVAGDDVTFICNARVALPLVEYFVKYVSKYVMYGQTADKNDLEKYGLSICAGISYINSHFPFHIGYQVAETCCDNAKKIAKENMENGKVGNWIDFQICKNVQMGNLELARIRNYNLEENLSLIRRPYHISCNTDIDADKEYELSTMVNQIKILKQYPKSKAMQLRNTYPKGNTAMESLIAFMKTREMSAEMKNLLKEDAFDNNGKAVFYDALEMYDYYESIELEEEK